MHTTLMSMTRLKGGKKEKRRANPFARDRGNRMDIIQKYSIPTTLTTS
jgi:hypothetical protein